MDQLRETPKVWGKERWVVNCSEYCAKFLIVDQGAQCSYHHHPKKETFFIMEGSVILTLEGVDYTMSTSTRPKTIQPGQLHSFHGITSTVILEVSTHDDGRVERRTASQPGVPE